MAAKCEPMNHLVVFDTNVFVSYLLPSKKITAVHLAVERIFDGKAIPVYSDAIMAEYNRVLYYPRLKFLLPRVCSFLQSIIDNGYFVNPAPTSEPFSDASDKPFYDAAITAGAWLVTGNKRHFPDEPFIVSPRAWLERVVL